jgi:4'-phosphopantetheinyl transferase
MHASFGIRPHLKPVSMVPQTEGSEDYRMPRGTTSIDLLFAMARAAGSALDPKSIHAWTLSRQQHSPWCDVFFSMLSADEQEKAWRFRTRQLRQEFVISRTLLRVLLAGYCACSPSEVQFSYGQNGKPALKEAALISRPVAFNLSHSADAVYIVVTDKTEIGVDVEQVSRARKSSEAIASSCLDLREAASLAELCSHNRIRTLLRYWTHKEAYLKAVGCGLSVSPQEIGVRFVGPDRSVIGESLFGARPPMFGHDLICAEDYVGVVVTADRDRTLNYYRL